MPLPDFIRAVDWKTHITRHTSHLHTSGDREHLQMTYTRPHHISPHNNHKLFTHWHFKAHMTFVLHTQQKMC